MYSLELHIAIMVLIGYLFGSIPIGYLYAKAHGVNIFEKGSGNPGSTNVGRILGKVHGRIIFIFDIIKTTLPILIAHIVIINLNSARNGVGLTSFMIKNFVINLEVLHSGSLKDPIVIFTTGIGAILGHNLPFTTKFRGGKGITCTVAVVAYFNVIFAVSMFFVHKIIGKVSGYVSVASIISLIIMFLSSFFMTLSHVYPFDFENANIVLIDIFLMMVCGIVTHRDNIKRIEHGTENKI